MAFDWPACFLRSEISTNLRPRSDPKTPSDGSALFAARFAYSSPVYFKCSLCQIREWNARICPISVGVAEVHILSTKQAYHDHIFSWWKWYEARLGPLIAAVGHWPGIGTHDTDELINLPDRLQPSRYFAFCNETFCGSRRDQSIDNDQNLFIAKWDDESDRCAISINDASESCWQEVESCSPRCRKNSDAEPGD